MFESWRGVVGDIKPTHRPGSLEEFIKLLPDGIGVIPLTVGISSGTEQEFHDVLEDYKQKAAQLAGLGVDLISIGGAPPMMVHGFHRRGEDRQRSRGETWDPCQHVGSIDRRGDDCSGHQKVCRRDLFSRSDE